MFSIEEVGWAFVVALNPNIAVKVVRAIATFNCGMLCDAVAQCRSVQH